MPTSDPRFRKLLAAFEDEVQRKQHKMSKRVDARDEVRPNVQSGYCSFLRGQQVTWSPSFDVLGTWEATGPGPNGRWTWGWADAALDVKLRSRVENIRRQGLEWGLVALTSAVVQLASEDQAWELAMVGTALSSADAMHRFVEHTGGSGRPARARFLALFDGPPPTRSTVLRAVRPETEPPPPPPSSRLSPAQLTPRPPGLLPGSPSAPARPSSMTTPAQRGSVIGNVPATPPPGSLRAVIGQDPEPTSHTRAELAQRLLDAAPPNRRSMANAIALVVQAHGPSGRAPRLEVELTVTPPGERTVQIASTTHLEESLLALWHRMRAQGKSYRVLTARMHGGVTHIDWSD